MNDTTVVSFPGIGIGEMTINKVAFELPFFGGLEVRWYGILLTLGIVAGFFCVLYRAKFEGFTGDDIIDYTLLTVVLAIIGARAYYVLTTLDEGLYHSFYDVIAIWEGGIAMYGSIIGGAAGLLIVSRLKHFGRDRVVKIFDMAAPGVMLGQVIGRWGNFVNGEAHGVETSESFFLRMGLFEYGETIYCHPTFLYESLWNLVGFVLISIFYKKKKFDGQVVLAYLAWYGFGRMFIEGLRTDSLYIGSFRISQVVGLLCFVVCSALMGYFLWRLKQQEKDAADYTPVYENCRGASRFAGAKKQAELEGEADIDAIIENAKQKQDHNNTEEEENGETD